jgi:type IV pilus assembly protein PilC
MFGSPYSYDALAIWCRAIRHGHGAGLTLVKVFEMQTRSGPAAMRAAAGRISRALADGSTLEEALAAEGEAFPELFVSLAVLGEYTGHIPEVFGQLEDYFRLQASMQREFRARSAWPAFQFVAGVLVIALTIFILGLVAESNNTAPTAPIGFGLTGTSGAIVFLLVVGGTVGGLYFAYKTLSKTMAGRARFEAKLLRIPVVGPCAEAVAMSRFCLAMKLTLDSSLSVFKAIKMSLRATDNEAFISQAEPIARRIKKGEELADAIGENPIFPREFHAALTVGEVSGQIPEVMARQAAYFQEEMVRRMKRLTWAMTGGVYAVVGIFMIVAIFRMFSGYAQALNG